MARRRFSEAGIAPGALAVDAVTPAMRRRRMMAGLHLEHAGRALRDFGRDAHVFGLTKGQFSMIDLASAVLQHTGPADVAVWTWCIAEYEVEAVTAFLLDGRITRFRMVMDWAGAQRDMPLVGDLQERFGLDCIRVTKTHAKIVLVSNEAGWRVAIRGSMNLNANPRFEQFDVSDDPAVFAVIDDVMDEMWRRAPALPVRELAHRDAANAGDLGGAPAWMNGLRPWRV